MLHGHLDNITSLGYIEGWAYDSYELTKALEVSVIADGHEAAWGLAHRFRADLMAEDCGLGWCAFRLKLQAPVDEFRFETLRLRERPTGEEIFATNGISMTADGEKPLVTVDAVTAVDPTIISGVWQLRGCEQILLRFIQVHGVEAFLSAAYSYVLERPADNEGLTLYARSIRHGSSSPVGILEALADTDEFRACIRQLAAPNSPTFPFL